MTRIDVTTATADAVRIAEDPATWLPAPARPSGVNAWTTTLRVGPLHRQVVFAVGPVVRDDHRVVRHIGWAPGEHPGDVLPFEVLLPSFNGELIADQDSLRVIGSYEPPVAWLGQVADVALRNAAIHTVKHLLDDVVAAMSKPIPSGGRP